MTQILPIKNFPDYFVDEEGNVYSKKYHHTLNKYCNLRKIKPREENGYLRVGLHKNNRQFRKNVHRLVAEVFIPNPENKPFINHKNGIKDDNQVANLEWCTQAENIQHAWQTGLAKLNKGCFKKGFTGKQCINHKIVLQMKDGNTITKFYGTQEAYRKTGICQGHIAECCRGERKSAGGYQWQYLEEKSC